MYNPFPQPSSVPLRNRVVDPAETEKARTALRQTLVSAIQGVVSQRRLTHTEASFETRIGRTVITAVLNGNLNKISTDRLLRIANRLGLKVELKISIE